MARGYRNLFKHVSLVFGAAWLALLLTSVVVPASAQSAKTWNKRGQDARAREDYDAAYEAFRQAHLKKPADLRYKTRFETSKFEAGAAHVDRGRVLKQSGDTGGAVVEYQRALAIDPGNQAAAQELTLLQGRPPIIPAPGQVLPPDDIATPPLPTGPSTSGIAPGVPLEQQAVVPGETIPQVAAVSGPVVLQSVSNVAVTLHMVADVKDIYQAIGKAAGLNVLFDPEYTSKRIPIDLTNVTYLDALRIVGTIAGTFYKPVTPNTIFVAQNTRAKRTDLDELAVQTFYLTNASQQSDANEILTAIRNILDPSVKVYLVPSQNAIVMRATPDQLLLMQKLLNDLDRAKAEVVVDVAVLEVNKDKVRNLGITLPTSFGLTPQATTSTSGTSTSSTSTSTGTTTATTSTSNLTLDLVKPQFQQLCRIYRRRHRQRPAHRFRHAHPPKPAHPCHRRPARHPQNRLQDPHRHRQLLLHPLHHRLARRPNAIQLSRRRRQHRHDPDRSLRP